MARSSRASPGGSSVRRQRCTRRSLEVTVPSDSKAPAAAGNTTSAMAAVSVRNRSWTISVSSMPSSLRRAMLVGFRLDRVLADDVDRLQLAALHRVEHRRQVPPALRRHGHAPGALELRPHPVVLDVLEARQAIGQRAHVAATLDVVLAAQRVDAAAPPADVPGEQREVDERQDVVDGVVMLGDAQRPAQHRARRRGVGVGHLADHAAPARRSPVRRARASSRSRSRDRPRTRRWRG